MNITIRDYGIGHQVLVNGVPVPIKDHSKYISERELQKHLHKNRFEHFAVVGGTYKTRVELTFAYDDESFSVKTVVAVSERKVKWTFAGEEKVYSETKKEFYENNRSFDPKMNIITPSPCD